MIGQESVPPMEDTSEVNLNPHSEMIHVNFVLIHWEIEFLGMHQMVARKTQKFNASVVEKFWN